MMRRERQGATLAQANANAKASVKKKMSLSLSKKSNRTMQVTQDFESSILEMDKENSFDLHNRASTRPSIGAKREAGVLQDISNEEDQCTQCTCGRSVKRSTFQHAKICNLFHQQIIKKPLARCVSRTPPFAAAKSNLKALQRAAPPPSPSLSLNWTPDTSFAQSPLRHNGEEQDDHDTVTESMSQYDEDGIKSEEEEEAESADGDGEANFTPDVVRVSRSGEKAARKSLRCASPMVILSYRSDSEDEEAECEPEPEAESESEDEAEQEVESEQESESECESEAHNARGNTGQAVEEEEEEELFLSQTSSSQVDEPAEAIEEEQGEISIIFEDDGHPLPIATAIEEEAASEDETSVVQRLHAEAEAEKREGTDETAPATYQQFQIGEEEEEGDQAADAADDSADALLVLLRALRLDHHHARFVEEEVSLGDVLLLTDEELERHLGLRLGPRRRLRHAIAQLALPPAFPSSAARRVQDTLDRVANVGSTETSSLLRE